MSSTPLIRLLLTIAVLGALTAACGSDEPALVNGIDPNATALPAPVATDQPTLPEAPTTTETAPGAGQDGAVADDLPPIVIDQAVGVAGSGVGGGSIELTGTANVYEATILLELLDQQGNVIEAPFATATCGTGCRGDWSHVFGDLEPGTYTVTATEDDPSGGEGPAPFRTEVTVEVPAA